MHEIDIVQDLEKSALLGAGTAAGLALAALVYNRTQGGDRLRLRWQGFVLLGVIVTLTTFPVHVVVRFYLKRVADQKALHFDRWNAR